MYGIINKSIEDLVASKYGTDKWKIIKENSHIDIDYFISNEPYDDEITYKLVIATSNEMNLPVSEVFASLGEWWIFNTSRDRYAALRATGGDNLREFLINFPNFHNRIYLVYPKLTPPEFKVDHIEDKSLHLHYFSQRSGLQDFIRGLLNGLSDFFSTPIEVTLLKRESDRHHHFMFKISWV